MEATWALVPPYCPADYSTMALMLLHNWADRRVLQTPVVALPS